MHFIFQYAKYIDFEERKKGKIGGLKGIRKGGGKVEGKGKLEGVGCEGLSLAENE